MKAGMLLRSKRRFKDTNRRWLIKKEGVLTRHTKNKYAEMIKAYRVAPVESLDKEFWVTEEQLHHRFEEAV